MSELDDKGLKLKLSRSLERYKIVVELNEQAQSLTAAPRSYSTNLKKNIGMCAGWYTQAEFDNAGGIIPTLAHVQFPAQSEIEFFITKAEFQNKDKYLWVWCDPHGEGSVKAKGSAGKFTGRVHIPLKDLKIVEYPSPKEDEGSISGKASAKVSVTESALYYTAFAMKGFATEPVIQKIKDAPANNGFLGKGDGKRDIVAAKGVPSDTSEQAGVSGAAKAGVVQSGAYVNALGAVSWKEIGAWDIKPQIYKVWGNIIRLGNEMQVTQDRHLSNICYGFLCAAAGLTWQEAMHYGSGPLYPYVKDNEVPVKAGHQLYSRCGANVDANDLKSLIYVHANTQILLTHNDFKSTDNKTFNIYAGDNKPTPPGANDRWK